MGSKRKGPFQNQTSRTDVKKDLQYLDLLTRSDHQNLVMILQKNIHFWEQGFHFLLGFVLSLIFFHAQFSHMFPSAVQIADTSLGFGWNVFSWVVLFGVLSALVLRYIPWSMNPTRFMALRNARRVFSNEDIALFYTDEIAINRMSGKTEICKLLGGSVFERSISTLLYAMIGAMMAYTIVMSAGMLL